MFTRTFVEIAEPFEAVEEALLGPPRAWLPGALPDEGHPDDREIDVRIGAGGLSKKIHFSVGPPTREPTKTSIPITWSASGPSPLFPVLNGTLEIANFGDGRTLFAMLIEYDPPMGIVGDLLDRALLHRLAEATLGAFRDDVSHSLGELVHHPGSSPIKGSN